MAVRSALINVMTGAALRATRRLVRDFGEMQQLQVSAKGARFAAAALSRAEQVARAELAKARPEFGFATGAGIFAAGSGGGEDGGAGPRWIVGPLDGAANFAHGLPHFALAIAVVSGAEVTAGVVYDPLRDEMFRAEKGAGCYLNDGRLRVSSRGRLDTAMLGAPPGGAESLAGAAIRRLGSPALDLAYVAAGRLEACWCPAPEPREVAAGAILVRESGGLVSAIDGGSARLDGSGVFAANDRLHDSLAAIVGPSGR